MRNFYAIFKKEFKSYFNLPIAYIYITVFLVLSSWLYLRTFFIIGQASMRSFFSIMPWMFLFFVPAITMRLWAEEKKLGTMEMLMTLPVKDHEVVLGKFFASFCFLSLTVLLSFPLIITVYALGNPDGGPIIGSYLGLLLMGAAYLAVGLFISSLTENQIIAFIISIVVIFALIIVGEDMVLFSIPDFLVPVFSYLSLSAHFSSIGRGVIDSRDLVYYFSVIGFFLYLNVRKLETGKWK
ncbi:ABC transporter permease subunit [Candidatus Poribacteria bacterium]|nr:ABC transporter permease subunit [Candidatus Poribacteria bacterium]